MARAIASRRCSTARSTRPRSPSRTSRSPRRRAAARSARPSSTAPRWHPTASTRKPTGRSTARCARRCGASTRTSAPICIISSTTTARPTRRSRRSRSRTCAKAGSWCATPRPSRSTRCSAPSTGSRAGACSTRPPRRWRSSTPTSRATRTSPRSSVPFHVSEQKGATMWSAFATIVALATILSASGYARAQDWPAKPVKIVAPFAPGGTSDTLARVLAENFSQIFRQTFYIENRPGAGGLLGSSAVATAEPDGYTLVLAGIASHVIAPAYNANPPYDGVRDFTHIAYLGGPPVGLLVHPGLGFTGYREFLAFAKASPAVLDYTSSGTGTLGFIVGDELARKEKLRLNHIPYKGGGPAMLDLVAGHVRIATMTFSSAAEQVRAGAIR